MRWFPTVLRRRSSSDNVAPNGAKGERSRASWERQHVSGGRDTQVGDGKTAASQGKQAAYVDEGQQNDSLPRELFAVEVKRKLGRVEGQDGRFWVSKGDREI